MTSSVPDELADALKGHRPLLAFSGGVDSVYLLHACRESGIGTVPVFLMTGFQTKAQAEEAESMCQMMGSELKLYEDDVFQYPDIIENTEHRCYLCKRRIFSRLKDIAEELGCDCVMDGTNASDDPLQRPGMRALEELGIRSPLRECGLTKDDIRRLSKIAGLPTWDKPSDSCLATRIPVGMTITREMLERTETAERIVREYGLSDFRVRTKENGALLEVLPEQQSLLDSHRDDIGYRLSKLYGSVAYGIRGRS